VWPFGLHD
jgi:hypothetical protein